MRRHPEQDSITHLSILSRPSVPVSPFTITALTIVTRHRDTYDINITNYSILGVNPPLLARTELRSELEYTKSAVYVSVMLALSTRETVDVSAAGEAAAILQAGR